MNGSNHLAEMDGRPMWFCPECVQKVWWGCDVEPVDRYRSLAEFADQHELEGEGEYWKSCLKRLTP
jgi:archaemetzincin